MRFLVLACAAWAVVALAFLVLRARAYGQRRLFAKPQGDRAAGVRYAFTGAMAPWAKESVRMNLASYAAGMLYHAGIFAALALLAASLAGLRLPPQPHTALGLLAGLGGLGGLALFLKRACNARLRGLSHPDDFLANLLATALAGLACATAFRPALECLWRLEASLLFLYIPFGKLRHCCFFFMARRQLGAFFGYRGTFPPTHRA